MLKCLLSPDVRQLATTSADKTIKLWNLDGFTLDRTLVGTALMCCRWHAYWFAAHIVELVGLYAQFCAACAHPN